MYPEAIGAVTARSPKDDDLGLRGRAVNHVLVVVLVSRSAEAEAQRETSTTLVTCGIVL
jgi:hypothetical protein